MSVNDLRPVQFKERRINVVGDTAAPARGFDYSEGHFHKWHTSRDDDGNENSIAVIERENGHIILVNAMDMKFTDRHESETSPLEKVQ